MGLGPSSEATITKPSQPLRNSLGTEFPRDVTRVFKRGKHSNEPESIPFQGQHEIRQSAPNVVLHAAETPPDIVYNIHDNKQRCVLLHRWNSLHHVRAHTHYTYRPCTPLTHHSRIYTQYVHYKRYASLHPSTLRMHYFVNKHVYADNTEKRFSFGNMVDVKCISQVISMVGKRR